MKKGLTLKEHIEVGNTIKTIRLEFMRARRTIGESYTKNSLCLQQINKVSREIDQLRNILDNTVCQENPKNVDAPRAYYGNIQMQALWNAYQA